jgi:hypothetical protein
MQGLSVITDREESRVAFDLLTRTFVQNATAFRSHAVGWPGGSKRFDVYWHSPYEIWGTLQPVPPGEKGAGRFWNCFGIADPLREPMLSITVEINPPHQGENRNIGGAFLRNADGQFFLGHTGKVGGGRPGVSQESFLTFYQDGPWRSVTAPRGPRRFVVFGPIDDGTGFLEPLSRFVHTVARFKEAVRSRS